MVPGFAARNEPTSHFGVPSIRVLGTYRSIIRSSGPIRSLLIPDGATYDGIVTAMGFAGGLILFLASLLLIYLYGKLNDAKLIKVPPEVGAQATCDFSPENIRLTAARLKESPLQITDRLPPRTGRRYIVVGGVSKGS